MQGEVEYPHIHLRKFEDLNIILRVLFPEISLHIVHSYHLAIIQNAKGSESTWGLLNFVRII